MKLHRILETTYVAFFWIYSSLVAIFIFIADYSNYAWMLDDLKEGNANPYCVLPIDNGVNDSEVSIILLFFAVFLSLSYSVFKKKIVFLLIFNVVLLSCWFLKFHVFNPMLDC